jgi:L-glyceraldehyde 3-phosphate reductase
VSYDASPTRYDTLRYNRCGRSGLKLPAISLGLWHNFGGVDVLENNRAILRRAFDLGITHFDLANNYGPPPGSAEETFGLLLAQDFRPYRDELIISSKAGYLMWPGPYGEWGSRKYLVASCDQSLKRMGLSYVDIFYSHRPDPETPLEETMQALDYIVRSGRALYAGISSYNPEQTRQAARILRELGTPCLIHQPSYSMFNRWVEDGLLDVLTEEGIGCIVFSPLFQGLLTDRYLGGIPEDSRAGRPTGFLRPQHVTEERLAKVRKLNEVAQARGQTMAQLAIAWVLRQPAVTSALIGASRVQQVEDIAGALNNLSFSAGELARIEAILAGQA